MERVLKVLELDNIKKNKGYLFARIVFSALFGISFFLDSIEEFGTWHGATYKEVYFKTPEIKNFIILFFGFILSFIAISVLGNFYNNKDSKIIKSIKDKAKSIKIKKPKKIKSETMFIISFFTILLCWLPVVLTFVPGGIFDDTYETIKIIQGKEPLTNHHPLLFYIILKLFINLGTCFFDDLNMGLVFYTVLQIFLLDLVISNFIAWMYEKKANILYIILLILFFSLFKLVPLYTVSIWKDTPYCIAILYYTLIITKIVYSKGDELERASTIINYLISAFLVAFLRNNGIFVVIGCTCAIIFAYKNKKLFIKTVIIQMIVFILIQGPLYKVLKINGEFRESVGPLIQQICYVVANDGNVNEEELEFINNIEKIENIKERYSPVNVDMIKYYEFNDEFLENNKIKFIKIWISLFIKNPTMYTKAYLLNTTGYWDLKRVASYGKKNYVFPRSFMTLYKEFQDTYWQLNITYILTGKTPIKVSDFYNNQIPYAWFGATTLLSAIYILKTKKYNNILMYLPGLLTLATVFIAVPIAFGMRYIFSLALVMPFSIYFPLMESKK